MANLYTPFTNGTFEGAFPAFVSPNPATLGKAMYSRSADEFFEGAFSLKGEVTDPVVNGSGAVYFEGFLARTQPGYPPRPIALTAGKTYIIKARVFVPSGSPFATSDALLALGGQNQLNSMTWVDIGAGQYLGEILSPSIPAQQGIEALVCKVSGAIDAWIELTYKWKEPNTLQDFSNPFFLIALRKPVSGTGQNLPLPSDQSLIDNGVIYIDKITIDEEDVCDLELGSPSYTKTDETGTGLNDGTITVNSTSSYIKQYSLDGGAIQSSNNFAGVAPGNHSVEITDTNPAGCSRVINDIIILAFNQPPPEPPPAGGTLTIDSKPVNLYNFVSWFTASGTTGFSSMSCVNKNWDIANAYRLGKWVHTIHAPVIAFDKPFTFYINLKDGIDYVQYSSLKLGLINHNGLKIAEVGTLKRDVFNDGVHYNLYCDSVIVPPTIKAGYYRLAIYDTENDYSILYVSNDIEAMSLEDSKQQSINVKHRASFNMYGYRYSAEGLETFFNDINMRMYKIDEQTEGDIEPYRGASTGILRLVSFELDKWIALECYFFDDLAHRAMQVFQAHNYILINDIAYLIKSIFKSEFDPISYVNKGRIELYEQDFSTANRYAQAPITIIGSEDPLLLGDNGEFIKL